MTGFRVEELLAPAVFPHPVACPRLKETHISWIVLTGPFAYKIKKPVRFPFLDASTLERRRWLCEVELRLNRRFAPDLYVDVVPIARDGGQLVVGGTGQPVEFAVRMHEFDPSQELAARLDQHAVTPDDMRSIAAQVAGSHQRAAVAPATGLFGIREGPGTDAGQFLPAPFATRRRPGTAPARRPGRAGGDEITIFDSVGFALEDFSALRFLHRQHLQSKGERARRSISCRNSRTRTTFRPARRPRGGAAPRSPADPRVMRARQRRASLIGAPTDVGAAERGASMGPEALRVAGLVSRLGAHGLEVVDRGNLGGPGNPWQSPVAGYRHLDEVVQSNRLVHDAVLAELRADRLPVLLGGGHSLAIRSRIFYRR